jgi:hypothetical protein
MRSVPFADDEHAQVRLCRARRLQGTVAEPVRQVPPPDFESAFKKWSSHQSRERPKSINWFAHGCIMAEVTSALALTGPRVNGLDTTSTPGR